MNQSWAKRRLRIDLSKGKIVKEDLREDYVKKWIGGRGFNSELVYNETWSGLDPYNPDNPLCFAVGPLCGTIAPSSGRVVVSSRSPLTMLGSDPNLHGPCSTNMGGLWGPELRFAGYDQLVIKGRAKKPVYINISDEYIEICDASHLWGKSTYETAITILSDLEDPEIKVICIGLGGEKLVRFAGIVSLFPRRTGGKGGLGAVMGSKNLKAIAVRGTKAIDVYDEKRFMEVSLKVRDKISVDKVEAVIRERGTFLLTDLGNEIGFTGGYKNHSFGYAPEIEKLFGSLSYKKDYFFRKVGCYGCSTSCGRYTLIKGEPFDNTRFEGPEVESVCSLGPRVGIDDLRYVLKIIEKCEQYGLDTISTGAVISWAMECYEKGLLSKDECNGLSYHWGDVNVVFETIDLIAKREGFGNLLAEGVPRAALKIGKGSQKYVIHIKGINQGGYDPRIAVGFSLGLAISTEVDSLNSIGYLETMPMKNGPLKDALDEEIWQVGPSYLTNLTIQPKICRWLEDIKCICDLLSICWFRCTWASSLKVAEMIELFNYATGSSFTIEEMFKCAERVINLERAHWCREGGGKIDDWYVDRYYEEPIKYGLWKGSCLNKEEWDKALSEYYRLRGWEKETGFPTEEKLKELGIGEIIADLKKAKERYLKRSE